MQVYCRFDSRDISRLKKRLESKRRAVIAATERATKEGGMLIQGASRNQMGLSGPKVRTGTLWRSIVVSGQPGGGAGKIRGSGAIGGAVGIHFPVAAKSGRATFGVEIGPTVIYGRIQELGGHIVPKHLTASGAPGWLGWGGVPGHREHFARSVTLRPRPYMKPGLEEAKPRVAQTFYDRWRSAWVD